MRGSSAAASAKVPLRLASDPPIVETVRTTRRTARAPDPITNLVQAGSPGLENTLQELLNSPEEHLVITTSCSRLRDAAIH